MIQRNSSYFTIQTVVYLLTVPVTKIHDIVEAHCYFVDIGRTDREQIHSRINNNDCRTF